MVKRGMFMAIDGIDGSGKATQTALLLERLKKLKIKVKKIDFPQYEHNFFGKLIRECLDGKRGNFLATDPRIAAALYAADRFESSGEIRKWLDQGYVVIADRYVSANQIHQGGKIRDEKERALFLEWLDEMEFEIFKIPRPDYIFYLHVPIEVSLGLIKKRAAMTGKQDVAESDEKHLLMSQQSALKIVERDNKWFQIGCAENGEMMSREKIHELIFEKVKKVLKIKNNEVKIKNKKVRS